MLCVRFRAHHGSFSKKEFLIIPNGTWCYGPQATDEPGREGFLRPAAGDQRIKDSG